MTPAYDIFISYRRESGSAEARLIQMKLIEKGHRVFLDVTDLRAGLFDEALLAHIARTPNFIVILSPGALDRCVHSGDWLRREILHALDTGSNIVPVTLPGFKFPPELPESLQKLPRHQDVEYSHRHFDSTIDDIARSCAPASARKRRAIADLDAQPPVPAPPPVIDPPKPLPEIKPAPLPPPSPVPVEPVAVQVKPLARSHVKAWLALSALAILLAGLFFAFHRAPQPAHPPAAAVDGFERTRWKEEGSQQFFDFLPGGVLEIHDAGYTFNGHWERSGDAVSIDEGQSRYHLTVAGDQLSGTYLVASNQNSQPEKLNRVGPVPPQPKPPAPRAEKTAVVIVPSKPQTFVPGTTIPPAARPGFRIAPSVTGTTWRTEDSSEFFDFLPGGVLNLRYKVDGRPTPGHWKQSGDRLTADSGLEEYDLTVSGDEISGTWRTVMTKALPGAPIKLHRMPTPPR